MFSVNTPGPTSMAKSGQNGGDSQINRITRVSDLPSEAQITIEQLDAYISSQTSIAEQLKLNLEQGEIDNTSVTIDAEEIQKRSTATATVLLNDKLQIETVKAFVEKDYEHAHISTRFIDGVRSGTINPRGIADHILKYFNDEMAGMEQAIDVFERTLGDLYGHAATIQHNDIGLDAITLQAALRAQQQAFIAICSRFASTHEILMTPP